MDTSGRPVAVVTGDAGGLGRFIATRLAERASEVVLMESTPLADVPGVRTERADWADVSGLQALIDRLAGEVGGIDELVNVPTMGARADFFEVGQAEWDEAFAANSKRIYFLMQAAARIMSRRGGGRIVNVVTIDGKGWWGTTSPALAGTEAAVIAVDRIAALQLSADDINVNTVCTGLIADPGQPGQNGNRRIVTLDGTPHEARASTGQAGRLIPIDRANEPDDIAAAVEYLLSPGARNVTGQCLNVNGGLVFD